jgi:hypothetical protein
VPCASYSFGKRVGGLALVAAAMVAGIAATTSVAAATSASSPASASASTAAWSRESLRTLARPQGVRMIEGLSGDARATVDALERAGYHVDVAVLPSTFYVRERAAHSALPAGFMDVSGAPEDPLLAASVPLASPGAAASLDSDPFEGRADMLPPLSRSGIQGPNAAPPLPQGLPHGARWTDTSEFMIGRVAVEVLFPESDGSIDANLYDWTPALRDSVIRSTTRGLLKWSQFAAARGIPLTFLIEVHASLPTGYEPIARTTSQELDWIAEMLEPLAGYGNDAEKEAFDVCNAARARLGTHWATLLLAVQNDTDPDGAFPDGFIAHANLGGPWFVVPVNNSNTRSAALDYYVEHEVTHQFWALDEYPSNNAWWSCTLTSGYFGWPNSNSVIPAPRYCGPDDRCLMKGNYPDSVCASTLGSIGWGDRDHSGVIDLYETRPAVRTDSLHYGNMPGFPIHVTGTAGDVAFPNTNPFLFGAGDSITLATIDSLWYRVDEGAWTTLPSDDGVLDQGAERFSLTFNLPVGDHVVRFRALNSSGREQLVPDSVIVTVSGSSGPPAPGGGGSPAASVSAAPTPSNGRVHLAVRAPRGARTTAEIFSATGRRVRGWDFRIPDSGLMAWDWNGDVEGGRPLSSGVYYLRVRWDGGALLRRVVLLR